MERIDQIIYDGRVLSVYGTQEEPCFLLREIGSVIEYDLNHVEDMIRWCEHDEYFKAPKPRDSRGYAGHKRKDVYYVTESGLYNIFSQTRKPLGRKWRMVVHDRLIKLRKERGLTVSQQFDEWFDEMDDIFYNPEDGQMYRSMTVPGGDVEIEPV